MRALVPFTAATYSAVSVAMPLKRPKKLSAVRSPVSSARVLAAISATTPPAGTASPSLAMRLKRAAGSSALNAASARSSPATVPGFRSTIAALPSASAGMIESVVMSPASAKSSSSEAATARSTRRGGSFSGKEAFRSCMGRCAHRRDDHRARLAVALRGFARDLVRIGEREIAAHGELRVRRREVAAELRAAALLPLPRRGRNQLGGGEHIGEPAVAARVAFHRQN